MNCTKPKPGLLPNLSLGSRGNLEVVMKKQELWRLEEQFWTGSAEFYEEYLSADALMVFADPAGVLDREASIQSIQSGSRWKNVSFSDQHSIKPAQGTSILVYTAKASRSSSNINYSARCSSTYVITAGKWRLALHQQTPLN